MPGVCKSRRKDRFACQTDGDFVAAHGIRAEAAPAGKSDVAVFLAKPLLGVEGRGSTPDAPKATQGKARVEDRGGFVRRRVAGH
jgi:hypothetical protein